MTGHECFKLYMPLKLHFTKMDFSVWETRHLKTTSLAHYQARNDVPLFERLARQYTTPRDFVRYCVANYAYNNKEFLYSDEQAEYNYKRWISRKQSISRVFENDLHYIEDNKLKGMQIFDEYVSGKITVETVTILNDINKLVDGWATSPLWSVFTDDIMIPLKLKRFVKYDVERINSIYKDIFDK